MVRIIKNATADKRMANPPSLSRSQLGPPTAPCQCDLGLTRKNPFFDNDLPWIVPVTFHNLSTALSMGSIKMLHCAITNTRSEKNRASRHKKVARLQQFTIHMDVQLADFNPPPTVQNVPRLALPCGLHPPPPVSASAIADPRHAAQLVRS